MSKVNTNNETTQEIAFQTSRDLTNAIFIVSVLLNLAVFIAWLLIITSHTYNLLLVTQ